MSRTVVVLDPAADEARETVDWYERRRSGWGARLHAELRRAIDSIEQGFDGSPDLTIERRDGEPEFRRVFLRRFPLAVVFYCENDRATVVAVAHLRRMPGYWRDRAG